MGMESDSVLPEGKLRMMTVEHIKELQTKHFFSIENWAVSGSHMDLT